jgi:hypothetical protein
MGAEPPSGPHSSHAGGGLPDHGGRKLGRLFHRRLAARRKTGSLAIGFIADIHFLKDNAR